VASTRAKPMSSSVSYKIEKIHSFGSGQIPPPIYFSRRVNTLEEVKNIIFSGILNDCKFFDDGYTSDDECVDKDYVYTKAFTLSNAIVSQLEAQSMATVESHTSPHNFYTWIVQRIENRKQT